MIDFQILGGLFDLDSKIKRKEEIEKLMLDSSFWDDSDMANELTSELKGIKSVIQSINNLDDHISSNIDLLNEASDDEDELSLLIFDEYKELKRDVDKLEIQTYLNGEYDGLNAIIEIHAGAGGTESCDWANMLFRMTIVLFYLTSKMGMKLELSLLCFKLMVLMLMDV